MLNELLKESLHESSVLLCSVENTLITMCCRIQLRKLQSTFLFQRFSMLPFPVLDPTCTSQLILDVFIPALAGV